MFPRKCAAVIIYLQILASASLSVLSETTPKPNEHCYGSLGCLNITESLTNPVPALREKINTIFTLFTEKNKLNGWILSAEDEQTITRSKFESRMKTVFVIHGYAGWRQDWMSTIKDEILLRGNANIILVHWTGGSRSTYPQSAANTRIVGLEIAHLLRALQNTSGFTLDNVHLIGHSLGAHCASFAGKSIPGISRITALDPASLLFEGRNAIYRLTETDAKFVDVIHTDSGMVINFGLVQTCGHLDFYPNNGKAQPGCGIENFNRQQPHFGRQLFGCNHFRSIAIFIESINSKCSFPAYQCSTYQDFLGGKCLSCGLGECAVMGYHAKTPTLARRNVGKYFLLTTDQTPFCGKYYKITLTLFKPQGVDNTVDGALTADLYTSASSLHSTVNLTPLDSAQFNYNSKKYVVIVISTIESLTEIHSIKLHWSSKNGFCLMFCKKSLYVESVQMESIVTEQFNSHVSSKTFIPGNNTSYAELESSKAFTFY